VSLGRSGRESTPHLRITRTPSGINSLRFEPKRPNLRVAMEMTTLTDKDAKDGFGRLIDLARLAPVTVAKHGRPVVVVMSVEEFERLKGLEASRRPRPNIT
jgi:prevent-host-death family protein